MLSNEVIKFSVEIVPSYFKDLFNLNLSESIFPSEWSKGYIIPIHKSGDNADPNNFRGICVSNCLGKFFTSIMNNRLNDFLERKKIINKRQIGFRKNTRKAAFSKNVRSLI